MKTRRALQIIVGILSLLMVACLLAATAGFEFLLFAREEALPIGTEIASAINRGLNYVAVGILGLSQELTVLVPALMFGLPCLLFFIAAVLLFVHKTPKQAKYIAGNILALIAVTIFTVSSFAFASDILGGNPALDNQSEIVQKMLASSTAVRIALGCLLALFVWFIGLALGLKPKKEAVVADETVSTESETAAITEEQETAEIAATAEESAETEVAPEVAETEVTEQEEVASETEPVVESATTPLSETPATEYVPQTDVTVNDIVESTYGADNEDLSPEAVAKINKLRMLLSTNAITEQEYIKLVNIYLGKR